MTNQDTIINYVRLGIGHSVDELPKLVDWEGIETFANQQGLLGVLFDGIGRLPQNNRPSQIEWLRLIGEVMQGYEQRYALYRKAVVELATFYNAHGYKMMLLKGLACGLDWPRPEHRPYGDIDIWLFGQYKEADATLTRELGIKIDNSQHHHTVFQWQGITVENHYDFRNVHHHKSSVELEKIFKRLGEDDSYSIELYDEKVYLPSPNLHALFLLKHSMSDFAAFYVTLRQVLDWAFYVQKYHNEIDWEWLMKVLEKFRMKEFFDCINAICVEDLGFDANLFPAFQKKPILKDKVLSDILVPRFTRESPGKVLPRVVFKYRRWKSNAWKHQMCYNESMGSAFWTGMINHLLKPSSI